VIRLAIPSIGPDELQAVAEVLESGYLVQGKRVEAFERTVAEYTGAAHAIAVSSCTAALHLGLQALGIAAGDIVVVTAYSWIATANVIELCGARPVFVDVDRGTFNMDPPRLDECLAELMSDPQTAQRVGAVLPVHTFGQAADMPAIMELAGKHDLPVVEDAACSLGATCRDRQAGRWGLMGCLSFHPRKAITTGEGGMVLTDDANLAGRVRTLRNHGLDPEAPATDFVMPGYNYRMTEFQAAMGTVQMTRIDELISVRRRLAGIYDGLLAETPVQPPAVGPDSCPVYQSYVVLVPLETDRDGVIAGLRQAGIEAAIGTIHMPMTSYFRQTYGFSEGDFPATDEVAGRSIALPLHHELTESDQQHVVRSLVELVGEAGENST